MLLDPRIIILFGANALLLYLSLLVNSSLAALSLYVLLLGPMIVLPALYLHHRSLTGCMLISGLWVDAALPSAFGLFTCAFLLLGTLISLARIRFRVEHNYHPILLAHTANLSCIALLTLTAGTQNFVLPAFWRQVLLTTLLSHAILLAVAPWFFNLERLLFKLCHAATEPDDFPTG
jgi:cell shape-determining protein MreD